MSKYNYKRDVFKGLNPFPFLGEVKTRINNIQSAPNTPPKSIYNPNTLSAKLHPHCQFCKISNIEDFGYAKSYTLVPDKDNGTEELAYFRAGQYLAIALEIDGKPTTRAYTIASSPTKALGNDNNSYVITVKKANDGYASDYILGNWKIGDSVVTSGPLGNFYYQSLRDADTVVCLAGGSGITPFISMAAAVSEGIEDFNMIILYGSKTSDSILLKTELDLIASKSNGKVKVVNVLSDETAEGYENGFITSEIIKKYVAAEDYSVFVCGPKAMYKHLDAELKKLGLKERRIRFELSGEYGDPAQDKNYPAEYKGKKFKIKVLVRGESFEAECESDQTLLNAMESAGISVPSDCRSGECGWCHSRLISGNVFIPEKSDKRRAADKKFGWIHPCITYPLSDIEIEVFPLM